MAFESLSERLNKTFRKLSGQGKLTEKNMNEMLKEVRMSLLEADVNYGVVKDFIERVKEKALGQEVMESLNPSQMVVKIVRDEIQNLLGSEDAQLNQAASGPTTIMMVGLQGTGKTTAAAKIARYAKTKQKKKVLLVAADIVRPAAIEQLQTLGGEIGVEVFSLGTDVNAVETARQALERKNEFDLIIFDTAGRLHIDEDLMQELADMKELVQPDNILLTVDAMTGQDIVTVAREFNDQLGVTGLVVTKLDGDARGGGLLSVRSITDVPVLFVSSGEKVSDLEEFHPDRMANRILGMGDILSVVEKAQETLDEELAQKSAERMMAGVFTMNDMLDQYHQLQKMGSMKNLLRMMPGLSQMAPMVDDEQMGGELKKFEAIIYSMTPREREHPEILQARRKQRIAAGAGVRVADVNKLCQQHKQMATMMKSVSSGRMPNMGSMLGRGGGGFGASKHAGSKKKKVSKKHKKKK